MKENKKRMDRRLFLKTGVGAVAGAASVAGVSSPLLASSAVAATKHEMLTSPDEIFGWVQDMWTFGNEDRYGYRMPGTKSDKQNAEYIFAKFNEFGLKDTKIEPHPVAVAFPDTWKLTVRAGGKEMDLPCYFLRYAKFTDAKGITAPLVYVGKGTDADYQKIDVKGKIVVADVISDGTRVPLFHHNRYYSMWPQSDFTYDPANTLADDKTSENWPNSFAPRSKPDQLQAGFESHVIGSYTSAVKAGAVGFVGILELMGDDMNQFLHWYASYEIPAVSIGVKHGAPLREALRNGDGEGTIVLTGRKGQEDSYNIYGFVPGKSADEIIVVHSHHDGWAVNEATGASTLMTMARYFAQLPPKTMNRTIMFVAFASHFGMKADWTGGKTNDAPLGGGGARVDGRFSKEVYNLNDDFYTFESMAHKLLPKVVCANNCEMFAARQYKKKDGQLVPTGRIAPAMWGVSGPKPDEVNSVLLGFVKEAIETHKLDRSLVWAQYAGEGSRFPAVGVPGVHHISFNATQFSYKDTPETVMKEWLQPYAAAYIDIVKKEDTADAASLKPVVRPIA